MLLEFSVENYLSFKTPQTLRLVTAACRAKSIREKKHSKLNSVFIYGPNSSGKSNLLKAIEFSCKLVNDYKQWGCGWNKDNRIQDKNNKLTAFEYVFSIGDHEYAYGFKIYIQEKSVKLHSEWLLQLDSEKEVIIFSMNPNSKNNKKRRILSTSLSANHKELNIPRNEILYSPLNPLFLTGEGQNVEWIDNLGNEVLSYIRNWFEFSITFHVNNVENYVLSVGNGFVATLESYLDLFGTGITNIVKVPFENPNIPINLVRGLGTSHIRNGLNNSNQIIYINNKKTKRQWLFYGKLTRKKMKYYELRFLHENKYMTQISEESLGTKELIRYFSLFESAKYNSKMHENQVIVLDEIECSLHSLAVLKFLEMIKKSRFKNLQIIATTHESHLLNSENIDPFEIWFVDCDHKKGDGSTLCPLYAFGWPPENCQTAYLEGRFFSIPRFTTPKRE